MRVDLLGPEAAMDRVREIRAKIEAVRGGSPSPTFEDFLGAPVMPSKGGGLTGALPVTEGGKPGAFAAEVPPANPFLGDIIAPSTGSLRKMAREIARSEGIDERVFEALVEAESDFNPMATSKAGAMGLTQLMPGTAKELGITTPLDPEQNLRGGARYLAKMLMEFGEMPLALAAYNAGPGRVRQAGNKIPDIDETQNYVAKIMAKIGGR